MRGWVAAVFIVGFASWPVGVTHGADGPCSVPQTSAIERELQKAGFGLARKEIAEISIEELLAPDEPCVGVATGSSSTVRMAPGAVTVFKREELRDLGARTLGDALRLVPGVDISRDALGRPQISMRGIVSGSAPGV